MSTHEQLGYLSLRRMSIAHFRRQALGGLERAKEGNPLQRMYAVEATTAACMGIEEYLLQGGLSPVDAQNIASSLLGRVRVEEIARQLPILIDLGRHERVERLPGDLEQNPLLGIHRQGFAGRNAEEGVVELIHAIEKATKARAHLARSGRIRVVIRGDIPAAIRHFGDTVAAVTQQPPEGLRRRGPAREAASQTDDRNRLIPRFRCGIEASLRRIAHYDYWSDKVRRSIVVDSKCDLLLYGNAERALVDIAHRLARRDDADRRLAIIRSICRIKRARASAEVDNACNGGPKLIFKRMKRTSRRGVYASLILGANVLRNNPP